MTDWLRRVARLRCDVLSGSTSAMDDLSLLFRDGVRDRKGRVVVRRNLRESFRLLRRAAVLGDASAAFSLGYAYDRGLGTPRDTGKALWWYRRAAREGYGIAASNIATIYRDQGKPRLAFRWWMRAFRLGDGDAAVDVGYCYQYGIGTRRNEESARSQYKKAMTSRHITAWDQEEAMYHLAVCHLDEGRRSRAVVLLDRAAADADYPEAMSLLKRIRSGRAVVPCRCRRGMDKRLPGHAACPRHPRTC